MKKFLSIVMVVFSSAGVVSAKVGDIKGSALHTDIVAYINHYAISSYAVNGQSCVVAEDLRDFGFDVEWNESDRSLNISRNSDTYVTEQYASKNGASGSFFADILETDISVFANETKLTSYAINGYTMIPLEELCVFGEVYWLEDARALKLWIDGLEIRYDIQPVTQYIAPVYISPLYSESPQYSSTVYITPTGKRYHYSKSCAGKNGSSVTISKAKSSGYTPCKKCG